MMPKSHNAHNVEIRAAVECDAPGLERLAALDSAARVPDGPLLVAVLGGRPIAAVGADGTAIADPFHHTADLVEFLRTSGARRLAPATGSERIARLRPRRASRRLALAG